MAEQAKDDKPFLSRWSERKRAGRIEETSAETQKADKRPSTPAAAEERAELDANRATAEAIDLETLTDRSDYAPFFRTGVPSALKYAALRKLWRSNPVFAVRDGLCDYDGDYTWPAKGSEVVKTAWKVGRGFLTGEDQAASEARAASVSAEDAAAVRARAAADAAVAKGEDERGPPQRASAPEHTAESADDDAPETEEAESVKVSLARRLDLAAFAREGGEG